MSCTDELTTDEAKAIRPMDLSALELSSEPYSLTEREADQIDRISSGRRDVEDAALVAIQEAMNEGLGSGRHLPGSWRTDPWAEHFQKARGHLDKAADILAGLMPDDGEDHLGHALSRLAMLKAREKRMLSVAELASGCSRSVTNGAKVASAFIESADNAVDYSRSVSGGGVPCG